MGCAKIEILDEKLEYKNRPSKGEGVTTQIIKIRRENYEKMKSAKTEE